MEIWFLVSGIYALFLVGMAAEVRARKTSWRELAPAAALIAAMLAVVGAALHLFAAWVEQSGWSGVLGVIGILYLAFILGGALVGGLLNALYRD